MQYYVETAAGSQQGRRGCLINGLQTIGSGPPSGNVWQIDSSKKN